jgi:hypothetical protein
MIKMKKHDTLFSCFIIINSLKGFIMNKKVCGILLGFYANLVCANDFAYVTNAATPGSISVCHMDGVTGEFVQCTDAQVDELSTPLDIAFATMEDDTTYAYIANNNYPNRLTQCTVGSLGQLTFCMHTQVPSYVGITLHKSDRWYAYLTQTTSVQKCTIGAGGQLDETDCHDSNAGNIFLNGPMYITFQTFNNTSYAYITNGDYHVGASVIRCKVQGNGDFADCVDSGIEFNGAADVDFADPYAYITEPTGAIIKCLVDETNGLFNTCSQASDDFQEPIGMTIKKIGRQFYVYVVDGGFHNPPANRVKQCGIDLLGDLDCTDSGAGEVFSNPFGIGVTKN